MDIDPIQANPAPSGLQLEQPGFHKPPRIYRRSVGVVAFLTLLLLVGGGAWLWAQGPQPAFGTLAATPPNFVFNTPTTVTFTIRIDTPTLNPSTVELLRVDAAGNLLSRVSQMYDNGQNSDARPGDNIFTARAVLNESEIGRLYFRVAAAFRGNDQNAHSAIAFVDVDPFALPPDPGEAGKKTLEGIDSDHDGLRDDVQRFIALEFLSEPVAAQEALTQFAESVNQIYADLDDPQALRSAWIDVFRSEQCMSAQLGEVRFPRTRVIILSEFTNTSSRNRAWLGANRYVPSSSDIDAELGTSNGCSTP